MPMLFDPHRYPIRKIYCLLAEGMEVVGIDEAQFLDSELPQVVETLAKKGIRVIIAGLDMDFEG
jgi:thymidine kinase